jgi:hypothetical protein
MWAAMVADLFYYIMQVLSRILAVSGDAGSMILDIFRITVMTLPTRRV